MKEAEKLFGRGNKPEAILLTHGHFDHVGALHQLAVDWNVPVYAHLLELPYLTGRSDYPPPDPSVGGGAMAWLSWVYPNQSIDLNDRVQPLYAGGEVPSLPDWRWIHTPGHAPGHVSFFRESDRTLLAGDAFVNTKQESFLAVVNQTPEVHGPPRYFTPNWRLARQSVRDLADLKPETAATGHGPVLRGASMRSQLEDLAEYFEEVAIPKKGRYVDQPAQVDEQGIVTYLPPAAPNPGPKVALGLGVGILVGAFILSYVRGRRKKKLAVQREFYR